MFLTREEKNIALLCHLSAFAMFIVPGFGNILGPLVVWLFKKDTSSAIDMEGKESLNFQITVTIAAFVAGLLSFVLIGIPLLIAVGAGNIVFIIIASIAVSEGRPYRYPINLRLIK